MNELESTNEKSAFMQAFKSLRPDLYFPESWSDEERKGVLADIQREKTRARIFTAIPLRCRGPKCEYAQTCPLQQRNIAPIGEGCPLEHAMMVQFAEEYMTELNVNPENLVEVSIIRDLVDQEIQYLRKSKILAQEHFIQENVIGIDDKGNPMMKKELHLAVELEDKLHKRKKELRNQLLATREARAKATGVTLNAASIISDQLEAVRAIEIAKEKKLKAEAGTLYVDEYIQDAEIIEE